MAGSFVMTEIVFFHRLSRTAIFAHLTRRGASDGRPTLPTCRCCGEPVVIGFYPTNGGAQFFCKAHEAAASALFDQAER
jgi:hypothetical protein